MPRGTRLDASGVLHHVMARGIMRHAIFCDDSDRNDFVARLGALANSLSFIQCSESGGTWHNRSTHDLMLELTGIDSSRCPTCKQGTMVIVAELPKPRPWIHREKQLCFSNITGITEVAVERCDLPSLRGCL